MGPQAPRNLWGLGFIKSWHEKTRKYIRWTFFLPVVAESFSLEMSVDHCSCLFRMNFSLFGQWIFKKTMIFFMMFRFCSASLVQVWCKFTWNLHYPSASLVQVLCKFGASLVQVWCNFYRLVQVWCKFHCMSASLHQTCTTPVQVFRNLHQTCTKLALNLHQTCTKLALPQCKFQVNLHQTCTRLGILMNKNHKKSSNI